MNDITECFKGYDGLRTLLEQNCMFLGLGKMNQEEHKTLISKDQNKTSPKQMKNKNKCTLTYNPTSLESYLIPTVSLILFPILGAGSYFLSLGGWTW